MMPRPLKVTKAQAERYEALLERLLEHESDLEPTPSPKPRDVLGKATHHHIANGVLCGCGELVQDVYQLMGYTGPVSISDPRCRPCTINWLGHWHKKQRKERQAP